MRGETVVTVLLCGFIYSASGEYGYADVLGQNPSGATPSGQWPMVTDGGLKIEDDFSRNHDQVLPSSGDVYAGSGSGSNGKNNGQNNEVRELTAEEVKSMGGGMPLDHSGDKLRNGQSSQDAGINGQGNGQNNVIIDLSKTGGLAATSGDSKPENRPTKTGTGINGQNNGQNNVIMEINETHLNGDGTLSKHQPSATITGNQLSSGQDNSGSGINGQNNGPNSGQNNGQNNGQGNVITSVHKPLTDVVKTTSDGNDGSSNQLGGERSNTGSGINGQNNGQNNIIMHIDEKQLTGGRPSNLNVLQPVISGRGDQKSSGQSSSGSGINGQNNGQGNVISHPETRQPLRPVVNDVTQLVVNTTPHVHLPPIVPDFITKLTGRRRNNRPNGRRSGRRCANSTNKRLCRKRQKSRRMQRRLNTLKGLGNTASKLQDYR